MCVVIVFVMNEVYVEIEYKAEAVFGRMAVGVNPAAERKPVFIVRPDTAFLLFVGL